MRIVKLAAALVLLCMLIVSTAPGAFAETGGDLETLYQEALHKQEGEGDVEAAAELYRTVIEEGEKAESLVLAARMKLAGLFEKQGRADDALALYRLIVDKAPGSPEAVQAGTRLRVMGADAAGHSQRDIELRLARRLPEVVVPRMQFSDFLNYLRSAGDINIVLDAALSGAAGESDWAVKDLALKDVSVEDVLNLVTNGFELDWTVWSGAVYISAAGKIQALRQQAESAAAPSSELTLLARKIALCEERLRNVREMTGFGSARANADDVSKAELDLISAKLEREALLRQLGAAGDVKKADAASRPNGLLTMSGETKTVTLADVNVRRGGALPMAVDLDTGETFPRPSPDVNEDEWFAAHPGVDLLYDTQLLLVGDGVKAALLPTGTTPDNVPEDIAFTYKAAAGGRSSIKESGVYATSQKEFSFLVIEPGPQPIYIHTGQGAYLVEVTDKRENESITIAYTALKSSAVRDVSPGSVPLSADEIEKLRKLSLLDVNVHAVPASGGQPSKAPAPAVSGVSPTRVVLLDADVEGASAAQVLNLETGEAIPVGRDGDMREFFTAHPGFNLFYDMQILLVGEGVKAALLPEGTTPDSIPADIALKYTNATGGPSSIKEPGIYAATRADFSFLVIEPDARPVYVETTKGAWLLTDISREGDSVSFNVTKLR